MQNAEGNGPMTNGAAVLLDASSSSNPRRSTPPSSTRRVGIAMSLALAAMLPVAIPVAAQEREWVAAQSAREILPSFFRLPALDERPQPLALVSGFFVARDGVLV